MTNDDYVINAHGAWGNPSSALKWHEAEVTRLKASNAELLEALQELLPTLEDQRIDARARSAIAKATGGTA